MRVFARLSLTEPIPHETTILNFRRLLEKDELAPKILARVNAYLSPKGLMLKRGSIVDATIIAAPSSTKNAEGKRDPEMHQTKKRNPVALRDEGAHWSRCRFRLRAHGCDDLGQRT
jgi:IS5 family transposase